MRSSSVACFSAAAAAIVSIATASACSANAPTGTNAATTCGAGTHLDGTQCVADANDAGDAPRDSAVPNADTGTSSDAAIPVDADVVVHDGDPCPGGTRAVCSGNHLFQCQLVNNGAHPLGTLWDTTSCDLLAGMCAVDRVGNGNCTGGGYTTCTIFLNDAGNRLDTSRCFSATVLEDCNGGYWSPTDCSSSGYVCQANPAGGGAHCTPP